MSCEPNLRFQLRSSTLDLSQYSDLAHSSELIAHRCVTEPQPSAVYIRALPTSNPAAAEPGADACRPCTHSASTAYAPPACSSAACASPPPQSPPPACAPSASCTPRSSAHPDTPCSAGIPCSRPSCRSCEPSRH